MSDFSAALFKVSEPPVDGSDFARLPEHNELMYPCADVVFSLKYHSNDVHFIHLFFSLHSVQGATLVKFTR